MKFKQIIYFFVSVLICTIIMVSIYATKTDYKNNYTSPKSFYMVSLYKTKSKSKAEELKSEVAKSSGAGAIYEKENCYYILGFCFDDKNQAIIATNKLIDKYKQSEILEITCDKLNKSCLKTIEGEPILKQIYLYLTNLVGKVFKTSERYYKNQNPSMLYNELIKIKLDLKSLSLYSGKNKDCKEIFNVLNAAKKKCIDFIESCESVVYLNKDIQKNINILLINCCFLEKDLRNSLNNI